MIELVFLVCSIVEGARCSEPTVPLAHDATMMHCLLATQIEGAKWASEHPNHYIQRATCRPAGHFART